MILTTPSSSSIKEPSSPSHQYSDSPPSYDAVRAEPHGFLDGKRRARDQTSRRQRPPPPLITGGPSSSPSNTSPDTLTPNRLTGAQDQSPAPLYLDPTTGEFYEAYAISDAQLTECNQHGHLQKTKFKPMSIVAAAVFFPWGLMCMMGSRVVYCERCGLVLRSPSGCKATRKVHHH